MQVMPETGRLGAAELAIDDYRDDRLAEPNLNIRIGSWYLAKLLEDFDHDLHAALAAYNAGPGYVRDWQQTARWRERKGIDRIPLMETRSYVLLVTRDLQTFEKNDG